MQCISIFCPLCTTILITCFVLYYSLQASTRRGVPSVNKVFGDKLAILGGDFLLSRASVALARLRNVEVRKQEIFVFLFLTNFHFP